MLAPLELFPVAERLLVALDVEFGDAAVQLLLRVADRGVVDERRDFLEEEAEQRAGLQVADRFFHVFGEVALQRDDRAVAVR